MAKVSKPRSFETEKSISGPKPQFAKRTSICLIVLNHNLRIRTSIWKICNKNCSVLPILGVLMARLRGVGDLDQGRKHYFWVQTLNHICWFRNGFDSQGSFHSWVKYTASSTNQQCLNVEQKYGRCNQDENKNFLRIYSRNILQQILR